LNVIKEQDNHPSLNQYWLQVNDWWNILWTSLPKIDRLTDLLVAKFRGTQPPKEGNEEELVK
jgi:hypothetical protein